MPNTAAAKTEAPPAVQTFLRWMQGAQFLERHQVEGHTIRLYFRPDEAYFASEELVARIAIGCAFSLMYRFPYSNVELHLTLRGQLVRVVLDRKEFGAFFSMTPQALTALVNAPERWDASPLGAASADQQWAFFLKFSKIGTDKKAPK